MTKITGRPGGFAANVPLKIVIREDIPYRSPGVGISPGVYEGTWNGTDWGISVVMPRFNAEDAMALSMVHVFISRTDTGQMVAKHDYEPQEWIETEAGVFELDKPAGHRRWILTQRIEDVLVDTETAVATAQTAAASAEAAAGVMTTKTAEMTAATADLIAAAPLLPDAQAAAAARPDAEAAAALLPSVHSATDAANTATQSAQQATAQATAAAGLIAWNGGDHTTIPADAGLYRIMTGTEAGQVWQRLADGSVARRSDLEVASAPVVNMIRSNLEVTREELLSGTFDAGTLSRIYSELGSLSVYTGTPEPVDNVRVFALADGKTAILDMQPRTGQYFGLRAGASEAVNTAALTDFAEYAAARTATNIADLLYAGARLQLEPGEYRYGDLPVITGNLSITSEHHRAAVLRYMGTGHSLKINSESVGPYAGAPQYTNSVTIERVVMMSEQGSGILLGSVIQPNILFNEIEFRKHALGYVIELGEAVYFVTVRNCRSTEHNAFLRQRDYCDRLIIEGCSLGVSRTHHLLLEGPTSVIRDNNFESTGGNTAAIVLTANLAGGVNILSNRFGPEGNPYLVGEAQKPAPYDIMIQAGSSAAYDGLVISNNHHYSRATDGTVDEGNGVIHYYGRKTAPVLMNCGAAQMRVSGNAHTNYSGGTYIVSGNPEQFRANTPAGGLTVDRLSDVSDAIRGYAEETTVSSRRRQRMVLGSDWFLGGGKFGAVVNSANAYPALEPCSGADSVPWVLKQVVAYVADSGAGAGVRAWVDVQDSIVPMPINGGAVPPGSPVYLADDGTPTLTVPTNLTKRVGWTVDTVYPARVRLDFGPLMAPAMPTAGDWVAGDVVENLDRTANIRRWVRLTTGSGSASGTDWRPE